MGDHELLQMHLERLTEGQILRFHGELQVKFEEEAILNGWGLWPFNFDPIWLIECTGYLEAEK